MTRAALSLFVLLAAACSRSLDSPVATPDKHLLVTLELSPAGLRILDQREVAAPLPTLRVPEPNAWHATFRDTHHDIIHEIDLPPADELRGEYEGQHQIDPHHTRFATAVFSLRLPVAAGTLSLRTDTAELGTVTLK